MKDMLIELSAFAIMLCIYFTTVFRVLVWATNSVVAYIISAIIMFRVIRIRLEKIDR